MFSIYSLLCSLQIIEGNERILNKIIKKEFRFSHCQGSGPEMNVQ